MEQCKITAIANQKGGVGKTVTTFNLGVGLARAGQRVLLVDADPQGSLTISMGIKTPDDLDMTITSLMQATVDDRLPPDGFGIIHSEEGVDLIPANIELAAFDVGLTSVLSREYVLRQTLEPLREQYDRILIDCMPSLGMTTINALTTADSVIIPSQPSYLSTKGLAQLMGTIAKVRRQLNPKLEIDGVLLTMVDNRTNNAKAIISSLRQMGDKLNVFETEIPFSVRAAETSIEGKSIFEHDGRGKVAAAYEKLTEEVLENEHTQSRSQTARTYHDYHRVNTVHLRNDKNDLGTQTLLEREKGAAESVYYSHDGVNDDPLFNFCCKNCDGFEVSVEYIILDCVIFLAPIFLFCTHSTGGQRNSIVFA